MHLFELPGPTRWAQELDNETRRGNSAIVFVPDSFSEESAIEDLADLATLLRCEELRCPESNSLAESIIAHVGSDGTEPATGDLLSFVVEWSAMRGRRLLVRSWESSTGEILKRWPQTLHAAGASPEDRPVIVLLARLKDVDVQAVLRTNLTELRVTWWWGALGQLDSELRVAQTTPNFNRLQRAVVAEIAAWDLSSAEELAQSWDGNMRTLQATSRQVLSSCQPPPSTGGSKARRSPLPTLYDSWASGQLDLWDGRLRSHGETLSEGGFARSLWHAQARVLLPSLEEARFQLEEELKQELSASALTSLDREVREDGVPEFAAMRRVLRRHNHRVRHADWQLITSAIPVRNCLAHMRPADADHLESLLRWLSVE